MRLHRFYIDFNPEEQSSTEDTELIHQTLHVFRYKKGQQLVFFNESGNEYVVEIVSIHKKAIDFNLIEKRKGLIQEDVLKREVCLCFSLIKKDNSEMILQKCTELGVASFFPLISERSEKKDFNLERGEKIIVEAVEQSGWSSIPKLHEVEDLASVLEKTKDFKHIVLNSDAQTASDIVSSGENKKVALFIGPEGGWSDMEIELFKKNNIEFYSVGLQTLRAETAAIVAVSKFI